MAPCLLIISIMNRASSLVLAFSIFAVSVAVAGQKQEDSASGRAVIREMNLARQNPALYATFLQELRGRMNGNVLVLPGSTRTLPFIRFLNSWRNVA